MDMGGMGGGAHGSHGGLNQFQATNKSMARSYWWIVLGTLGGFVLVRILNHYQTWRRYAVSSVYQSISAFQAC